MDAEQHHRNSTLAERRHWPARALRLLDAIVPLCRQWLEPALKQCLDRLDKELFAHAERSRSQLDQQQCFDSRVVLQQQRAAFLQACVEQLRTGFTHLGETAETTAEPTLAQPLSLLEPGEHELSSALDKLAARGEAQHRSVLSELSYRFAVLVAAPPLEGAALPISPAGLAQTLRVAGATLDLPQEHRLMLLQAFEQTALADARTLYESVNTQLRNEGLLPQLRPYAPVRTAPAARSGNAGDDATDTAANPEAPGTAGAPGAPITVLENLRELLAQQRVGINVGGGGRAATSDELQTALGALQQHLAQVTDQASRELRSAQRLRDELLLQLNAGKAPGAPRTGLSAEQDDTVELVARLFEQIGQQLHHGPHARSVLGDLQLPVLRLAVNDRGFFDQHEHPARRLLGAVAEAANDWLDGPDGEVDRQLTERLQHLVSRAQQEPPSAGLYTSLLADIEHQLAQLNRRAQVAERRHVEAMKGREKLDLARHRAGVLLAERFAAKPPRGLLRTLLDRAWADVLSLSLLQHGEQSPEFIQRLHATDQLLGLVPVKNPGQLQREVQEALQQIGMNADEAREVTRRLIIDGPEPAAAAATTLRNRRSTDKPVHAASTTPAGVRPPVPQAEASAPAARPSAPVAAAATAATTPTPLPAPAQRTVAPAPIVAATPAAAPAAVVPAFAKSAGEAPVAAAPAAAVAAPRAAAPKPAPAAAVPLAAAPTAAAAMTSPAPAALIAAAPGTGAATPASSTAAPAEPTRELPSATELARRLQQRQRLGEAQQQTKADAGEAAPAPLGPQEARIHNRLRQLPFGSWFEFTDTVTGETTRRKLAWFSPVSGNSLFVTRRGQRGYEMNLRELAQAIARGQVRELPPQHDNLLDRAWQSLTGSLSRSVAAKPTPGAQA